MSSSFAVVDSAYVSLGQVADKLCMASTSDGETLDTQVVLKARACRKKRLPFRFSDPLRSGAQLIRVTQENSGDGAAVAVCVSAFIDTYRDEVSALDDASVRGEVSRLTRFLGDELPTASFSAVGCQADLKWSYWAPADLSVPPILEDDQNIRVRIRGKVPDISEDSTVHVTVLRANVLCTLEESARVRRCLVDMLLPMVVARSGGIGAFVPANDNLFEHTYVLYLSDSDVDRFSLSSFLPVLLKSEEDNVDDA